MTIACCLVFVELSCLLHILLYTTVLVKESCVILGHVALYFVFIMFMLLANLFDIFFS